MKRVCPFSIEKKNEKARSTAVKFPHSEKFLAKNLKLALLKQAVFFDAKSFSAFGSADVLPHSSGNVLVDSEAKASEKLPRHKECIRF